jgi:hypothetical protein
MSNETIEELQTIGYMLDSARKYGIELEVIVESLQYMKENPKASPVKAFAFGMSEWVK